MLWNDVYPHFVTVDVVSPLPTGCDASIMNELANLLMQVLLESSGDLDRSKNDEQESQTFRKIPAQLCVELVAQIRGKTVFCSPVFRATVFIIAGLYKLRDLNCDSYPINRKVIIGRILPGGSLNTASQIIDHAILDKLFFWSH